jgi:hypothetical protein
MMTFRNMVVRTAAPDDIDYVVRRMRPCDRREVYALRHTHDAESVIGELVALQHTAQMPWFYAVARAAHPRAIALVGLLLHGPRHAYAQLIATAEVVMIIKDLTRFIRDCVIPDAIKAGFRRVELRTLASWTENRRWLELLGAKFECEVLGLGEPFAQYAWIRED